LATENQNPGRLENKKKKITQSKPWMRENLHEEKGQSMKTYEKKAEHVCRIESTGLRGRQ